MASGRSAVYCFALLVAAVQGGTPPNEKTWRPSTYKKDLPDDMIPLTPLKEAKPEEAPGSHVIVGKMFTPANNTIPARKHHVEGPQGVAIGVKSKKLYFTENIANVVREVDLMTGKLRLVAGVYRRGGRGGDGRKATKAKITDPWGMALDEEHGFLYLADRGNHAIRRIDIKENGLMATVAGTMVPGSGALPGVGNETRIMAPTSVCLHGRKLYFSDGSRTALKVLDLDTGIVDKVEGMKEPLPDDGETPDEVEAEAAVEEDDDEEEEDEDEEGEGEEEEEDPEQEEMGEDEMEGMMDSNRGMRPVADGAVIRGALGITFDALADRLYIAIHKNSIQWVDVTTGTVGVLAAADEIAGYGGDGLPARVAHIDNPFDLEMDTDRRILYICDTGNNMIRGVTLENNTMYTLGGPTTKQHGVYYLPAHISLDKENQILYIADSHNAAVRSIELDKVSLYVNKKKKRIADIDETIGHKLPTKETLMKDQRWEF